MVNLAVVPSPEPDGWRNQDRAQNNIAAMMREADKRIPHLFRAATADHKAVVGWVDAVVRQAVADDLPFLKVTTGPSLTLLGPTGVGKTYQAYGAVRGLAGSGVRFTWRVVTAADLYAGLQPRSGVDSEDVFDRFSRCDVLVINDLGAAKLSEWREEQTYRLVDHRHENGRPTVFTSNALPSELPVRVGGRVASRLAEMATQVVMTGPDRRLRGVR